VSTFEVFWDVRLCRIVHLQTLCLHPRGYAGNITLTMEEFYGDIYAVLGYYAAYSVNFLPTFRDDLSFAYSRVKKSFFDFLTFEGGITGDFPL